MPGNIGRQIDPSVSGRNGTRVWLAERIYTAL